MIARVRVGVVAAALALAPAFAHAAGAGQPCAASSDCDDGLRCVSFVCATSLGAAQEKHDWKSRDDETIGFVGFAIGGVLPHVGAISGIGAQLGIRLGTLVSKNFELQLEVSPTILTDGIGVFEATGQLGYFIPFNDIASWVVRFGGGGGVLTGNFGFSGPFTAGFGEFRFDLVGVAIRTSKHLFVEFDAPSMRMLFPTTFPSCCSTLIVEFMTNLTFNYVF